MSIGINFDKNRGLEILQCLADGKPLTAAGSADDLLMLAAACLVEILNRPPQAATSGVSETSYEDLHAALDYCAHLTLLVKTGEYDGRLEAHHRAAVASNGSESQVYALEGVHASSVVSPG